jgi:hypothetical protein
LYMKQEKTSNGALSSGTCAFVIVTLLVVGCGRFGGGSKDGVQDISKESFPTVDSDAPFPAMSVGVIDALIRDVPELARHRDEILEAERAAINGVIADIRPKSPAEQTKPPSRSAAREQNYDKSTADLFADIKLIPTAHAAEPAASSMGAMQQYLIGHQIGFFMVDAGAVGEADRGKHKTVEMKDEKTGTVEASMVLSVGKDGSVSTELTTKVSMPVFGLDANSKVKLTGNLCPNAEGKIDLNVEQSSNGRAGSSGSTIYDKNLTAKIGASVNEDAEVASMDLDLKQATRSTAGGRQVYVETNQSGKGATGDYSDMKFDGVRIDRASQQANADDAVLSQNGLTDAFRLAIGVLQSAKGRWQGGGCVKIDATSPGTVSVNSSTQIPVKVTHKFEGSEVPSKLTAALSGGASVDPTLIPKTAGTLTYVAPGETGKSATIKLTANSRRGRATLDLTASTGGDSYQIVGGLDDFQTDTSVCDIMKPFTLTGGGITNKFSGGLSGTYNFTGPYQSKGSGTYTISLPGGPGKPGTMTGQGSGSVMGRFTRSGTEQYTLTPIAPCS